MKTDKIPDSLLSTRQYANKKGTKLSKKFTKNQIKMLRKEFKGCDENGDGVLNREELKNLLENENLRIDDVTDEMVDEIMIVADINDDGTVSFKEFCKVTVNR